MFDLIQEAIVLSFIGTGIPLLVMAFIGLTVAVIQAVTQVQEQTLSYTVKLFTLLAVVVLGFSWWKSGLENLIEQSLSLIVMIGRQG